MLLLLLPLLLLQLLPQLLSRSWPGIPLLLALLDLLVRSLLLFVRWLLIDRTGEGKGSVKVPLAVKGRFRLAFWDLSCSWFIIPKTPYLEY